MLTVVSETSGLTGFGSLKLCMRRAVTRMVIANQTIYTLAGMLCNPMMPSVTNSNNGMHIHIQMLSRFCFMLRQTIRGMNTSGNGLNSNIMILVLVVGCFEKNKHSMMIPAIPVIVMMIASRIQKHFFFFHSRYVAAPIIISMNKAHTHGANRNSLSTTCTPGGTMQRLFSIRGRLSPSALICAVAKSRIRLSGRNSCSL